MARPPLAPGLDPKAFAAWYWQKTELMAFCLMQGLPAGGAKTVLTERVQALLSHQGLPESQPGRARTAVMPEVLALNTVIGPGWRFNQALRDFITSAHCSTLAQALAHYQASLAQPQAKIGQQFPYNQNMRDYFA